MPNDTKQKRNGKSFSKRKTEIDKEQEPAADHEAKTHDCDGSCVFWTGGSEFTMGYRFCSCYQAIHRADDCLPSDSNSSGNRPTPQEPLKAVEIRVVYDAVDILFANIDDAVYALRHLQKLHGTTVRSI